MHVGGGRSEKGGEGIWPELSTTAMNVRIETNNFHGTTLSSTDDVYNSRRFLNVAHFSHAFMRQNERNSTPSLLFPRLSSRGPRIYSILFHHFADDFHESPRSNLNLTCNMLFCPAILFDSWFKQIAKIFFFTLFQYDNNFS